MRDKLGRFVKGSKLGLQKGHKINLGKKHSKETKKKISESQKGKGHPHTEKTKQKMSQTKKGKIPKNINQIAGWNKGKNHSEETKKKMRENHKGSLGKHWKLSKENCNKRKGKNSHLWKGGITPINKKIRNSKEYKLWRKSVFERDNYTCKFCRKRGEIMHADHIKPFADYPELRFAIDNGRTLCGDCPKKTDTYGSNKKN